MVVDAAGNAHLLWSRQAKPADDVRLMASIKPGNGRWKPAVAIGRSTISGLLGSRVEADLGISADGQVLAAWCQGGNADNLYDFSDPGTISVRSARADGRWSPAQGLWTGQFCSDTRVQVNPRGEALLTWYNGPIEIDDSELLALRRPVGGAWPREAQPLPALGGASAQSRTSALLSPTGAVDLFTPVSGESGVELPRHGQVAADGALADASRVPGPTPEQTQSGWIGGGSPDRSASTVDAQGRPLVILGTAAMAVAGDGLGTSAYWAATKDGGTWGLRPIDDLAGAGDPLALDQVSPRIGVDDRGRAVATWVQPGTTRPCREEVLQATRSANGTWGRRVLVAERIRGCDGGIPVNAVLGKAPLVWWVVGRTLKVTPVRPAPGAAVRPRVRLRTRTFRQIREAGAIEFTCSAPRPGYCHVSLIEAGRNLDTLDGLEGFCRPSHASARVERRGGRAVVRFPLTPRCYAGGPAPKLRRAALRVPLVAAFDALGRRSGELRTTVTVRRR